MKKISIYQKDFNIIEMLDDDPGDVTLYTKEISKLMEFSKVCILELTSGNIIIKPSEISSIIITELENKKEKSILNQQIETIDKQTVVNKNDIIKD
jgi:hypothetical protein